MSPLLPEATTSFASLSFALETSCEPLWDSVSLYSSFQGFLFNFDGCLCSFTLLCACLPLGDNYHGRSQTIAKAKAQPGELWPSCSLAVGPPTPSVLKP